MRASRLFMYPFESFLYGPSFTPDFGVNGQNGRRGESMKARTTLALCLTAAIAAGVFLTGCASGHKEFLYVVGQGTNEVFEFRVQSNGTLVPLGVPNFPAGSNPAGLASHTSGDFLYIADFSGDTVTLLDINKSNGNLSVPVSSSIVQPVNPPNIFNTGAGPSLWACRPETHFCMWPTRVTAT